MKEILIILISWGLVAVSWLPIGAWFLSFFSNTWIERPIHRFILAMIIGAALTSSIYAFISIFFPINSITAGVVGMLGLALFGKKVFGLVKDLLQSIANWSILSKFIAVGFIAVSLICSTKASLNNDSGLYYIQFIKWINNYPVVPGLANLHDRLGFNSHWHLLSAAFDLQPLISSRANDLNSFLLILIGLGCADSAHRMAKTPTLFDAIWALFPLPFFLLMRFLTSSAPDLPSTLLPLLYFSLILNAGKNRNPVLIAGVLIVFAATIKVISILHGIILIPLLFTMIRNKEFKPLLLISLTTGIIVFPWIIRNVIQTGYLVFPLESIDIFSFDWKVPNEFAGNARKMVDTHARMGSYDLANYGKPVSEWFSFWFSVQSKSVMGMFAFVTGSSLIALLISTVNILRKKTEHVSYPIFLGLTVLISLAFWWKSGPNPRFIYGVIFFFFAYALAFITMRLGSAKKLLQFIPLLALLPMAMLTRTVLMETEPKKPTEFSVMESLERPTYYPSNTDKCWEHHLPCANKNRADIRYRGKGFEDGFANDGNH